MLFPTDHEALCYRADQSSDRLSGRSWLAEKHFWNREQLGKSSFTASTTDKDSGRGGFRVCVYIYMYGYIGSSMLELDS